VVLVAWRRRAPQIDLNAYRGPHVAHMSSTCQDCIDLLLDYVDGSLAPDMRARLEAHFGGCKPCVDFLASYRATPGLCRKAAATSIPDDMAKKLNDFLRAELGKERKP